MPMPSLELLLIAARALALMLAFAGFAWAFRSWRKAAQRDTQRVFEQLDLILGEVRELAMQVHARAAQAEATVQQSDSAARFAIAPASAAPRGYELAVRLAKNGASRDELMSSCGISRHEAELLLRLHGAMDKSRAADASTGAETKTIASSEGAAIAIARRRLSVVG